LLIREVIEVPIAIGELKRPALQPDVVHPLSRSVGPVDDRAGSDVLELGSDEGPTFAWLDVLEVDQLKQLAIDLENEPVSEFGGRCHDYELESLD
jgi:hypothetical protein